ncbi:MAG TPA: M13 family metallopeptidase [Aquaticitalea sp.]|nr:M13 family metallopeptidase [Aquaticitalea sp.]
MKTNNLKQFLALTCVAFSSLLACKDDSKKELGSNEKIVPGIELEHMDTTVSPKVDFYKYVNGNWDKNNTIPDDESVWGGFSVLRKTTRQDVMDIVKKAQEQNTYAEGTDQKKALLIFETNLDTVARDQAGVAPLKPYLDKIDNIKNVQEFLEVIAQNAPMAMASPLIGFAVFADLNNSKMNATYVSPGGLGLPERDYYLEQDQKTKEIRSKYIDHIVRMYRFIGIDEAQARKEAQTILALETKLAAAKLDKVESRDTRKMNNPKSFTELQAMSPTINWNKYTTDLGIEKTIDTVIVLQPKHIQTVNAILRTTPIEDLKSLLRWATVNSVASMLTTEMEKANWDFYSKTLNGDIKQKPADERALQVVNGTIGEAIGKVYVDAKFPPQAKAKAEEMIQNVIEAFQVRIKSLEWMSEETKEKAKEKLNKFTVKIGYPDQWKDYSKLEVKTGNSYFENMLALEEWERQKAYSKINEPVDKKEWGMSPQTVNAYFNPLNNEIVFPAAILQPPFYNYQADDAVNYGGIGAVIGHEISHAFDDSGARFDADGNLKNWWTDHDLEEFTKRGDLLAAQYSDIEVADSLYINGKFTLGENIGDLGGVLAAYDGLQQSFKKHGRPENIDGFTPEQRFFMSWTTIWRTLMRDEALRTRIKTDPHSPGMYRATQPLKNVDAFYEAFDIKEGDPMYLAPDSRVRIW